MKKLLAILFLTASIATAQTFKIRLLPTAATQSQDAFVAIDDTSMKKMTAPAFVVKYVGSGTQNYIPKWNNAGGTTIGNSLLFDSTATHTVGKVFRLDGLILKNGSYGNGKVLTSDANGLASWATPAASGVTSVATSYGLSGGTITSTGTLKVDTTSGTGDAKVATQYYVKTHNVVGATTNTVLKATSSTTAGNSSITDDGTTIGLVKRSTVGTIFSDDFKRASLGGNYTSSLATATLTFPSSLKLNATGGNNGTGNYITYTAVANDYDEYKITCRFIPKTISSTPNGFGLLMAGTYYTLRANLNINAGNLNVIFQDASATVIQTSGTLMTAAVGDTITYTLERLRNVVTATVWNETSGVTAKYIYNAVPVTFGGVTSYPLPGMYSAGINFLGGTQDIVLLKAESPTVIGKKVVVMGNSIATGYGSSQFNNRWVAKLFKGDFNLVNTSAGANETTNDCRLKINEIVALDPDYAIFNYGVNGGESVTTYRQYVTSIVDTLIAAGITPILVSLVPQGTTTITDRNTELSTLAGIKGIKYVNCFTTLTGGAGITMSAGYGTAPHPNDAGHAVMAAIIANQCPELFTGENNIRFDNIPATFTPPKYYAGFDFNGNMVKEFSGGANWGSVGNTGTLDRTNFIGTLDDVPLTFKVNNYISGRVSGATGTPIYSTMLGYRADEAGTSGTNCVGIGSFALNHNTGINNIGMGYGALYTNTSGNYNVGIGNQALYLLNGGEKNIAIGNGSQTSATGSNNVSIGSATLPGATGNYNVAIGSVACGSFAGSNNVAVGGFSISNGSGGNNAAVGYAALYQSGSAASCAALGYYAAGFTTGSNNTAMGYQALYTNTSGTNNTVLGYQADMLGTNYTNATAIGNGAKSGGSNLFVLGNTSVKVGVAMTTPTAKLHLPAQTSAASDAALKFTAGTLLGTIEAMTIENDTMGFYQTNSAVNRYAVGGVIKDFYADANNTSTTETDLYTYTTKANTLKRNGEKLTAYYSGTFNDVTATCQLKVLFGGTTIFDSGAITVGSTGAWAVDVKMIRTASTTVRSTVTMTTGTATTMVYCTETDLTGLTLSGTNIFKITGTAGGASGGSSDITGKMGAINWHGAANN